MGSFGGEGMRNGEAAGDAGVGADRWPFHRLHAAPVTGAGARGHPGGNSFDVGSLRWRPEGEGDMDMKRAMAHRLALAWNLCEGIPTKALEGGFLRRQAEAADALAAAVLGGATSDAVRALAEAWRELDAEVGVDDTAGRLHDCVSCDSAAAEVLTGAAVVADLVAAGMCGGVRDGGPCLSRATRVVEAAERRWALCSRCAKASPVRVVARPLAASDVDAWGAEGQGGLGAQVDGADFPRRKADVAVQLSWPRSDL